MIFAVLCFLVSSAQAAPWPGSGTPGSPYLISNANDMNAIGADDNYWSAHFLLTEDVNLACYTGTQFNIIGDSTTKFTGVFDGDGHTISNFTYTDPNISGEEIGIFGCVEGAIKNLGLIDPNVDTEALDYSTNLVGSLIGLLNSGVITDCWSQGGSVIGNCPVSGFTYVGGLVGFNNEGTITYCYATTSVTGTINVGGLVGFNYAEITKCHATGPINITPEGGGGGGLVGANYALITESFATGDVCEDAEIGLNFGGLVGQNLASNLSPGGYAIIINCYATGDVRGGNNVGGLIGKNMKLFGGINPIFSHCYSTGSVTGFSELGGLVGDNDSAWWPTDSVWDVNTSGQPTSEGGTGLTTPEMYTMSNFTDANWGFVTEGSEPNDVWTIHETQDYPKLAWKLVNFVGWYEVDLVDFAFLADRFGDENCGVSNDCDGADLDFSDTIDMADLRIFCLYWLAGQ